MLRQVLGRTGVSVSSTVPSTHCLYETVQKSRIKDVQAGVYLAHESDDASCVF